MTNGYKIRHLSNKELAEVMRYFQMDECCFCNAKAVCERVSSCKDGFLKWLNSEVDENGLEWGGWNDKENIMNL